MAVTAVTDFIPLAAPSGDKGLGALLEFIPGATIWTWIAFVAVSYTHLRAHETLS
jgi:hypothetical protein